MLNAKLNTLLDNLFRYFRAGENKNGVNFFRDRFQICIARLSIIGGNPGVYSVDLVPTLLELLVSQVTACVALVGYADDRDLLLCQEVLDKIIELFHGNSPLIRNRSRVAPISLYRKVLECQTHLS